MQTISRRTFAAAVMGAACIAALGLITLTAAETSTVASNYVFDPAFPKLPLPNKWTFGGVQALAIDKDDVLWVSHRPNDLNETENFASLNPPLAECCVKGPAILAFDRDGNLVHSFDTMPGHVILIDSKGQLWVGSNTLRIFTKDGKLVKEMPRSPQVAGRGGTSGPPIPPDLDLIAGGVEGAALDESAREVYVIDNYLGGRVMVFDTDSFRFKRGWGAYGKPLKDIAPMPRPKYDPKMPLSTYKDFLAHVTIMLSGDDVYVADRAGDRIQVFTKQGKFVREFQVAPETMGDGSAVGLALTKDGRSLVVADHMNNVLWLVDRRTDKVTARIGFLGRNGGGFNALHMVAVDSRGNIYTGEVDPNNRIQRFLLK
jgi:DNA-binding beta-propeller fold protein YncE